MFAILLMQNKVNQALQEGEGMSYLNKFTR